MENSIRVFVYRNIRSKNYSVKALEGPNKGRVIDHRKALWLKDCTFKVSEAGRQRVLRTKQKAVHAGVVGTLIEPPPCFRALGVRVRYNPYQMATFQNVYGLPVVGAKLVWFGEDGVSAVEAKYAT